MKSPVTSSPVKYPFSFFLPRHLALVIFPWTDPVVTAPSLYHWHWLQKPSLPQRLAASSSCFRSIDNLALLGVARVPPLNSPGYPQLSCQLHVIWLRWYGQYKLSILGSRHKSFRLHTNESSHPYLLRQTHVPLQAAVVFPSDFALSFWTVQFCQPFRFFRC